MFEREINSAEDFEDQIKLWASIKGFGFFILMASFPLAAIIAMRVDNFFSIWLFPAVLLLFMGLDVLIHRKIMRSKFRFWIRIDAYEPLLNVYLMIILGAIVALILFDFMMYLLLGPYIFSRWPIYFVGPVVYLLSIPFMYLARRYRRKKFKGERIKYFHGNKPEIEEHVKKALENMKLQYEVVKEGSKWTRIVPVYKIQGFDLIVKVDQFKIKEVLVATKVQNQNDLSKAKEIERAIDSHLSVYTLRTSTLIINLS